jgi:hypothetical protein
VNNKKCCKWIKFVKPFIFNNTYGLSVLTTNPKLPNHVFYVWLVDLQLFVLNASRKRDYLQMWIFVNVCSPWSMDQLKTRFEPSITRNDVYGVSLFHLSYLKPLIGYLCSQRSPNAQINYFMFDWSIYTILVLNRCCKLESLQIMIFVHVCLKWSICELITRFEKWITRNDGMV